MANRVQEDLKLIVGIDGTRNGDIPGHAPKESISGKRGIVYFNADGSSESTSGNTPGIDEEGNKEEGTTQPGADGAGGGTSGGGSNGGNSTSDAGVEDPYPIDDPAQTGSGIFSVDGMTLGDIVKGVSGLKDCSTGSPVDVRFDGQFTAPDGWDNPDAGPVPFLYEAGYFWSGGGYAWPHSTVQGIIDYLNAAIPTRSYFYDGLVNGQHWLGFTNLSDQSVVNLAQKIYKNPCGASTESYCTTSPEATEWPASKPMQLSYNAETGKYETHPMDSNVTTDYSQPVSQIELCNQAGDPIKSYPTADGGQALYNTITGIATFIDASGKVTGHGDIVAITSRLPR